MITLSTNGKGKNGQGYRLDNNLKFIFENIFPSNLLQLKYVLPLPFQDYPLMHPLLDSKQV
jgi:hypothetical protein